MHGMWTKIITLLVPALASSIVKGSSTVDDDVKIPDPIFPCPMSMAIPMVERGIQRLENDSLLYEGKIYPREYYWRDKTTNTTLGCICKLGVICFRKCCPDGKILHKNATCVDPETKKGGNGVPELKISEDYLAPDIRNITKLEEHFYVLKNRICPNDVFVLEPEVYAADVFVIDSEGVLSTKDSVYPPERYCVDWEIYTDIIRVVVCFLDQEEREITTMASTLELKLYPVGMIISIPFMIATLLVYATITELRNLYGKTLMCYVACLIYAYSSLAVLQLADVNQIFCVFSAIGLVSFYAPWEMAGKLTVLLLVLSGFDIFLESFGVGAGNELCPLNSRIDLSGLTPDESGRLTKDGKVYRPDSIWNQNGTTFACSGEKKPRLPICCPPGRIRISESCGEGVDDEDTDSIAFPPVYSDDLTRIAGQVNDRNFEIVVSDPCADGYFLEPEEIPEDEFYLLKNGSIFQPWNPDNITMHNFEGFCFGLMNNSNNYLLRVCSEWVPTIIKAKLPHMSIAMLISVIFLVATFIVYNILPEMRNMHGRTLSAYVGCLAVGYTTLGLNNIIGPTADSLCLFSSFTIHFSFLASFFWLNVMCFDIWWTFGGFRSLQGSIKQRERKKFLMYSIYAWGCAILLTAVCVIMDFVPGIPEDILRPEFGVERCWFKSEEAKALYFYGPMGVTVFCNIILFISTAAKIIRHKKDTAHHLKGSDSKRHDDNKQWFNLYLKLFIVMGINWSMEIISWLWQGPKYLWYLTDIANTLQGVIIFIIFVWKDKIKRLLIKRFDCKGPNFLSRDSTRSAYHSSTSRTCTTSIPLHEKTNSVPDPVSRTKTTSDDSDGV